MNLREYEGASGDVNADGFGPIFLERAGQDVLRGIGGLRDRVFEVTELEVFDPTLGDADIVVLFSEVWLVYFANDYYRGKADRVLLAWKDGKRLTFDYPPGPATR